jgi:stage II sporulation protein D
MAKLHKKLRIKDVKIAKKDKAGLVRELHLKGSKDYQTISGKELYAALKKDIKSFCYTVQRKKDVLEFNGRGYGHHLGICQWGAREMVRDGWPYKRILDFYYPGTTIMQLT